MPLRPSTKTYGELSVEVKRLFGDESGVQLEPGDILRWANQAQTEIVHRNKSLKGRAVAATAVGTDLYTFPDENIYEVASIQIDGSMVPNMPYPDAERRIMADDPDKTEAGRPLFWYTWGNDFWLWPVPNEVWSVTLLYTKLPEPLTGNDAQLLELSDDFFPTIVAYILSKAYEMDEDWTAANAKANEFETALSNQGEKERDAADMTYPVIQEVDLYG